VISLVSTPAVDRRPDKAPSRAFAGTEPTDGLMPRLACVPAHNTSVDVRQCRDYLSARHVRGGGLPYHVGEYP